MGIPLTEEAVRLMLVVIVFLCIGIIGLDVYSSTTGWTRTISHQHLANSSKTTVVVSMFAACVVYANKEQI